MKIPRFTVHFLLFLSFITAASLRMGEASRSSYPYYKSESAIHYRYAYMIGQKGFLPTIDKKACWPEGFIPGRVKATGLEFFTGYLSRIVNYFSDMGERKFSRSLTALFFSLLVFIIYRISYNLWQCRAGALFSSFMVAVSAPLIAATSGREYTHITYAAVLIALHILLLQHYLKKPATLTALLAAFISFALLAVWEPAIVYIAAAICCQVVAKKLETSGKLKLISLHLGTLIAGSFVLEHLFYAGVLLSLPASLLYASFLYLITSVRYKLSGPALLYVVSSGLVIGFLLKPFGPDGPESISSASYLLHRLMHISGKPDDPLQLPDAARFLWSSRNSYPPPYELMRFFIPLLFFIPPAIGGIRHFRQKAGRAVSFPLGLAFFTALLYLFDRTTIAMAAIGIFVCLSPVFIAFTSNFKERIGFIAVGTLLLFVQLIQPYGRMDLIHRSSRLAGILPEKSSGFTWVSIGNADVDLVRFLATRTSVRDPFLCTPDVSSLTLTFAGRTTVLVPGITTADMQRKTLDLMGKFYGYEDELYETCKALQIKYVLYSIDLLLDTSKYSPAYLAGKRDVPEESTAYQMHFFPENLQHFSLLFENDNYRLFKVEEKSGPIFMSDHPPVYQYKVFMRNNDTFSSFYERIIRVISMYAIAVEAQARGDFDEAGQLYAGCISEVPQFTGARLGLGSSLLGLGRNAGAKAAFLAIIRYAPDNPHALYGAAFAMFQLGELSQAETYLDLIITSTGDREVLKKARGLKNSIRIKTRDGKP